MKVETKFDIGQDVFSVLYNVEFKTVACEECTGTGKRISKNNRVSKCAFCRGYGNNRIGFANWSVEKNKIYSIKLNRLCDGKIQTMYSFEDERDYFVHEDNLFLTSEEAEKVAEERKNK